MKEKLFKIIPFISIGVVVLAFGFIFIPHSFVMFRGNFELFSYSGFQIFFITNQYFRDNFSEAAVSAAGIVTIVLMVLSIAANAFANKQSIFKLLGGILTASVGVALLSMQLWMLVKYPTQSPVVLWAPYVSGTFALVAGGLTIWAAIAWLIQEKNAPMTGSKTYSYLKK